MSFVRSSIGIKILSVALLMVALMAVVAGVSSLYLEKIAVEAVTLARYYIPVEQRAQHAARAASLELVHFERYINHLRADAPAERLEAERADIARHARQFDQLIDEAIMLVDKSALEDHQGPNAVAFMQLRDDLPRVARAHREMSATMQSYLDSAQSWTPISVEFETRLEAEREKVRSTINNVTALLDALTVRSADDTLILEEQARLFTWTITAAAAIVGLLLAGIITRYLVRPVQDLVAGTQAVRDGNLNVQIDVRSHDEIGSLADSFNHMIGGLKQKELIQDTFGKYVDPRIVKNLIDNDFAATAGEKQRMSVFFSDLQGFTSLCENLPPEQVVRFLNEYFTRMSGPLREEGGIIDKFIGDSVMAFWGPPFVEENLHPLAACRSAVAQIRLMEQFKRDLPALIPGLPAGLELRTRIGIATGEVTVGNIGSNDSRGYTVIGDTVNLAARLESASKQYGTSIIISEDTWTAAREGLEARELDTIRVVGKNEPVRIYEVLGLKGETNAERRELMQMYEAALRYFRQGSIALARAAFQGCLQRAPRDKPALVFLDRIATLERAGIPRDWDGVWTLKEK